MALELHHDGKPGARLILAKIGTPSAGSRYACLILPGHPVEGERGVPCLERIPRVGRKVRCTGDRVGNRGALSLPWF